MAVEGVLAEGAVRCEALGEAVVNFAVSHVVLEGTEADGACGMLQELYTSGKFTVARVRGDNAGGQAAAAAGQ
jgi:hypothetical protein